MNVEMIREIAAQLGIATDQLVGYFVKEIPALWIDFGLSSLLFVAAVCAMVIVHKRKWKKDEFGNTSDTQIVLSALCALVIAITLAFVAGTLSAAIKAQMAPEAYAIGRILG